MPSSAQRRGESYGASQPRPKSCRFRVNQAKKILVFLLFALSVAWATYSPTHPPPCTLSTQPRPRLFSCIHALSPSHAMLGTYAPRTPSVTFPVIVSNSTLRSPKKDGTRLIVFTKENVPIGCGAPLRSDPTTVRPRSLGQARRPSPTPPSLDIHHPALNFWCGVEVDSQGRAKFRSDL